MNFNAIDSPDTVSSSTHPRYVTSECCILLMPLYLCLCSPFTGKKKILSYPHQNEYLICYQQTSDKGFQSLY